MTETCIGCGELFIWERGKPGLRHECHACGERTERERGVQRVMAERYVPAYQFGMPGAKFFGGWNAGMENTSRPRLKSPRLPFGAKLKQ